MMMMGPLVPVTVPSLMMDPFAACMPVEIGAWMPGYVGANPAWQRIPLFNELALIQEMWPGAVRSVCWLPRGATRVDLEMPGVLPMAAIVPNNYPQRKPFLTFVDRGGFSTNAEFLAASRCLTRAAREARGHLVVLETVRCISGMPLLRTAKLQEEESMHSCDLDGGVSEETVHHCDLNRVDHEDALTCTDLGAWPPTPDSDDSAGASSWPICPSSSTMSTVTDAAEKLATTDSKQLCWNKGATLEVTCDAECAEGGMKEANRDEGNTGAEGNMKEGKDSHASFTGSTSLMQLKHAMGAVPLRLGPVRATGTRDYAKNWPNIFDDESDSSSSESSSEDDNDSDNDGSTIAEVELLWDELEKKIRQCRVKGSNFP